jgi:hypothetical protein
VGNDDLELPKFKEWLGELLKQKGNELYRTKGVIVVKGSKNK